MAEKVYLMEEWVDETLRFWFEELTSRDWFKVRSRTDQTIRERFLGLYERIAGAIPDTAMRDTRVAQASIIVYDQFPRNLFRGEACAFATDELALKISRNAIEKGFDSGLTPNERKFLYMPFMHSEALADQ
jgi:uncharacterized protein (DUF924 family)